MAQTFYNAISFNSDISRWNTGNVTNMSQMFFGTALMTADLSGWDVAKVTAYNRSSWSTGSGMTKQPAWK